jgi:hypothetical protein
LVIALVGVSGLASVFNIAWLVEVQAACEEEPDATALIGEIVPDPRLVGSQSDDFATTASTGGTREPTI